MKQIFLITKLVSLNGKLKKLPVYQTGNIKKAVARWLLYRDNNLLTGRYAVEVIDY